MKRLIQGYQTFKGKETPESLGLYRDLAHGQAPDHLFISCCDSRVQPSDFTGTEPGELFVERCLGNIIPEVAGGDPQLNSIIEYSMVALKVRTIVICGHTGCGAIRGLFNPDSLAGMPWVTAWLEHAKETLDVVREKHGHLEGDALIDAAVYENVLIMAERLKRMPIVAERIASGEVSVHAWVFEIQKARVTMHDPDTDAFIDLADCVEARA